ncbi:ABC transporter permease [Bifidobacterium asteroides]|uniref:ABC transporter permease n=1 Tax=Bifidobacterium asteroides TaxID=1684 RepID=UPI0027421A88|nr:FtsX-like permease family protein [Bifidobacterium asteroides]WLT10594.1 FtsX-like permease family protein [Bifidobacterium asteroides]
MEGKSLSLGGSLAGTGASGPMGGGGSHTAGRTKARTPGLASLVRSFLHEHRSSYTVMVLAVMAASVLTSAWAQVAIAARKGDGMPDTRALNSYDRAMTLSLQDGASQISIMYACICGFVSIFLVITSVGFLIERRRREYAMMRLSGASPRTVRLISLLEFMIPVGLAALIGSSAGCLLVPAFAKSLINSGLEALEMTAHPHPMGIVFAFAGILLAGLLGTWFAARRITAISPIEALQDSENRSGTKSIGPLRLIIALAGLAGGLAMVYHRFNGMDIEIQILASTGCLLVIIGALTPVLVPACANLIGIPFQLAFRGAGLLARQRARKENRSSTAIAVPIILMLVIVTGIIALGRSSWAQEAISRYKPVAAEVMVTTDTKDTRDLDRQLRSSADVGSAVTYSKESWRRAGNTDSKSDAPFISAMHINKSGKALDTISPAFITGSAADLGPGKVAVTSKGHSQEKNPLGRTLTLIDKNEKRHTLTITAIVDMTPTGQTGEYLIMDDSLSQLAPDNRGLTTLARTTPGVRTDDLISQLNASWDRKGIKACTKKEYIRSDIQRSQEVQRAMPQIASGAIVLTAIFLIQACAIAVNERRQENRRMQAAGVSRGTLVCSSIWESVIDALSATLLSALAMAGVLAVIFHQLSGQVDMSVVPLPYGYFLTMALWAIGLAAAASGLHSWFSSRADTTRR